MITKLGKFRCLKCGHHYGHGPDAMNQMASKCPSCGYLYVKWLNYEEDFALWRSKHGS